MSALLKLAEWASKVRPEDPMTLSTINDLSDAIRAIMGW